MAVSYNKLWNLVRQNKMKKGDLAKAAQITSRAMSKLNHDEPVQMEVMLRLCKVFHCDIGDIMEIVSPTNELPPSPQLPQRKSLKVVSLFSGAGGLDIGFEAAGFNIAVALEADPSCCDTLRTNRPTLPIINEKIENVSV